ncbi:MAG: ABC transporter permease [Lachnospiraceae bacterium]|nr:ABC transporter permease [Lachnospiraceae bacterium]
MKGYLDLIPISEKLHRRQSRMTRLCITLAVFLIAAIFGMADMEIRNQREMALKDDGAWHAAFRGVTKEQAAMIGAYPEVKRASRYMVTNYKLDKDYAVAGKKAAVCGFDEDFPRLYPAARILEGSFPKEANEAVVTDNLQKQTGISVGETVTLQIPGGEEIRYKVAGISETTSMMARYDAVGLFINSESYEKTFGGDTLKEDLEFFVEFKPLCNIGKTIQKICSGVELPEDKVGQNVKILALMLQSSDSYIVKMYLTAAALAVLVMAAGILMIASSMNSQVAGRTEFFGMLRCLGATCRQVKRFVRREALNWCRTAVPAGLFLSVVVTLALSQLLKALSPGYFSGMPLGISWMGLSAGTVIGVVTVLLAANVPAKRAAKVSPLTAVSGNAGFVKKVKRAAGNLLRVDISLGIHHAKGSGRTLFLMTGSFAFSMILFLAFSTMIDFVNYAITPLKPWQPDVSIASSDETCSIPKNIMEELKGNPAVKRMYGRSMAMHFAYPVSVSGKEEAGGAVPVCIISYESNQFAWAGDVLLEGSVKEAEEGVGVLADYKGKESLGVAATAGSEIRIPTINGEKSYPVSGILQKVPFDSGQGIIICSEEIFREITGEENYAILDIQFNRNASEADVEEIRRIAEQGADKIAKSRASGESSETEGGAVSGWMFSDRRKGNQEVRGAYYSFVLFVYGFLAVIVLITVFNIINSISMSVSARMPQFGTMRAIGMSDRQVIRMVAAEAGTYALTGIAAGAAVGILVNRLCYQMLITSRWGADWPVPAAALFLMMAVVAGSVILAVIGPAGRIREMSVAETIGI